MNITEDHWLQTAKREEIKGGDVMNVRRCAVLHFTSGASAQSSISFWRTEDAKGASAHIIIDRNGQVFQCRPFNRTCGHAGVSRWRDPKTGMLYRNINSCSIGIELANAGDSEGVIKWAKDNAKPFAGTMQAKHRNGGALSTWEKYPDLQIHACVAVLRALITKYRLDDITGHDCVAPERKSDPGPSFPMEDVRRWCLFSGLPEVFRA